MARDMGAEGLDWTIMDAAFSGQMRAVGVTPQDRIAIAVSGGADSMALCLLASRWMKSAALAGQSCGDLIGFTVDHNIRSSSAEETKHVKLWVSDLGFRCEILKCEWLHGLPPLGHLQESARNARYALLLLACEKSKSQVLLTAHHSDDQAELFILRLSRCSGVAGLAGMASARCLYPTLLPSSVQCGISGSPLLMRPLLQLSKDDLYSICRSSGQSWVEDPTNDNLSFARNRIRKALRDPSFVAAREEIRGLVSICRKVRDILDRGCDRLLCDVAVSQECGHVTLDVEKLFSLGASDAVIRRAIGAILQFVTQKTTPPRGRAISGVLEHLGMKSSKGAYTAGGCNISPVPGSKGFKVIVSFSPDSALPAARVGVQLDNCKEIRSLRAFDTTLCRSATNPIDLRLLRYRLEGDSQTISSYVSTSLLRHSSTTTPDDTISRFKELGLISDNCESLLKGLTSHLSKDMSRPPIMHHEHDLPEIQPSAACEAFKRSIEFGKGEYFLDRFVVSMSHKEPDVASLNMTGTDGAVDPSRYLCPVLGQKGNMFIRHYDERDMEFISRVAKGLSASKRSMDTIAKTMVQSYTGIQEFTTTGLRCQGSLPHFNSIAPDHGFLSGTQIKTINQPSELNAGGKACCSIMRKISAKEAYKRLKSLPAFVRRGLPVIVTAQGMLLGMPTVGYKHCPLATIMAKFRPVTPLGGGPTIWL